MCSKSNQERDPSTDWMHPRSVPWIFTEYKPSAGYDEYFCRTDAAPRAALEPLLSSLGQIGLNELIRNHAAAHSVVDLLKLTQGGVHTLPTPTPQIAHIELTLGAYHLFWGDAS